jgi:hypothetical protein
MFLQWECAKEEERLSLETLEMDRKAAGLANHETKVTEGKAALELDAREKRGGRKDEAD